MPRTSYLLKHQRRLANQLRVKRPKRESKFLTPVQIERIKYLLSIGVEQWAIAARFNKTKQAINYHSRKLKRKLDREKFMCESLRQKTVKTRKERRCDGCEQLFPVGTQMRFSVTKDGESVYNSYLCDCCQEFIARNNDGDCFYFPLVTFYDDYDRMEYQKEYGGAI